MQFFQIKLKRSFAYSFLSAILFFSYGCSSVKNKIHNQKMDIYILMGQSNMAGRGPLSAEYKLMGNPNVKVLTQDLLWAEAHHPLHFDKPKMAAVGPGLSFALEMQKATENKQIGLVPSAVGGTSIDSWVPGAQDKATGKFPYDDAIVRIKEAMKYGTIKGVIWHQGEADSDPEKAALYLPKLKALIERVRHLVGNEQLPFVAGELGPFRENFRSFNIQLNKLPAQVPFTAVASSAGLKDKGDKTHFDSPSATILGKRYSVKMMEFYKKK
jgi:hypothetical protein